MTAVTIHGWQRPHRRIRRRSLCAAFAVALPLLTALAPAAEAQTRAAKPTGFTATAGPGSGQVTLSWDDPSNSAITSYSYRVRTGSTFGSWASIPDSDADTTTYTVTGLTNGTEYGFRIRADIGTTLGQASSIRTATPVAPVTVAFAAGSAAVTVAEGDDSHAELTLELSAARSAATQVRLISNDETATGGSDFTAGPYTVNFPAGDTRATLRIAITDENVPEDSETFAVAIVRVPDGVSVGTPSGATVTIRDDDKPPPAPTGLTATSGAGSVTLAWSYAPHAPPAVDRTAHFQYRRGTGDPVFWGAWTLIPGSGAGTRSHTVAGLADGTEYAFQVRARARAVGGFRPGTSSDTARATPLGGLADKVRAWAAESACADECVADWKRALKALGETDSDLAAIEPMAFGEALTRAYTPGGAHRARWIEVATELLTLEVERVVVTIAASPAGPVAEGARVTFTLTLAAARSVQFDIFVNVADAPGSDFLAAADEGRRRVTLPVGETTAEFTVRTVADSADEPDGAVTATVLPVQDVYTVGSPASAQAAVSDDDEEEVEVDPMPAKPEGFTATAGPGSGQVTLSWDDPDNSAITRYSYRVRTGGAFGPWALIPGSDADTTTYTVTGLTNGTEYGFRIRADIGTTLGQASSIQTATPADPMPSTPVDPPPATPTDPPPATPVDPMPSTPVDPMPAKPEGFTATAGPGSGQVTLSWDDPGNSAITSYSYRVRTGGAFGPWALIPGSDADTTTYTVTGLTNGTEYGFRIRADIGTTLGQASSIQTATPADPMPSTPVDPPPATPTDPPPATPVDPMPSTPVDPMPAKPEGFTATAGPGSGQVTLSWDDPDNSAITRYSYRVRTGGAFGPWALIPGSDADTTTYTVTGLTNGTEYGFRIRADIGTTLGQASSIQTATPATVAAPNTAPTVAAAIQDQAAAAGAAFSYTFPEDAFSDADGDPLAYAAARGDGGALPAWLRFDASARAFSGTPGAVDSGVLAVRVTASDGKGGSASAAFNIVVAALPTVSVAAGPAVAEGGEALFTITVDPEPDGGIMVAAEASAAGNFVAAADLGGRSVTLSASRPSATISVATIDDDADEPDGAVTLTLIPSSGIYTIGGPASASVAVSDNDDPSLEVSESSLSLEEGASASYTVALEAAPRGAVAVSIAVSDGAGVEVSPTSLSFTAATWNMPQSVTVTALEDDDIDDESGSLIHAASGGGYDGVSAQVAVMVADDDEPSAAAAGAWMPRFGRVASEQIIEGIGDRVASRRSRAAMRPENAGNGDVGASFEAVFAGRGLGAYGSFLGGSPGGGFADGEQGMFAGGSDAGGNHASRGFPVLDAGGGSAGGGSLGSVVPLAAPGPSGTLAPSTGRGARSLGGLLRGALASSSFNAGGSTASGADWGLWGRGSMAALEGRSAMGAAVDGDVATGQVGADWSAGRWLFGISASYSRGDGDYADAGGGGSMESSMAALTPYAGVDAGRLSAWGAFGAGWGDMTLAPERGAAVKAGIDMRLGAAGFRGELMDFGDGFSLSLVSDAMAARSASDAADGLPEAEAEASRVRAAVEASWTRSLADGTRFSARLEGGVRMDGGAAEDGLGGEVSAGLSWLRCGLAVEIEGRRLVAHEDDDFAQTGVSAHLDWEVCGAGGLGPSASLRQRWGIATASGLEQLFAMRRMGRLGLEPDASGLDAELGWGVALPGGRFLGTPFMLHGTQARGSLQTLGWRIEPLGPDGGAADAGMALKLVRRAAGIVGRNDHGILLEARLGF